MVLTKSIQISTKGFCDLIDITDKVQKIIDQAKIKNGVVAVFVTGSTVALTTIEYEPNLIKDFQELIQSLIPQDKSYRHDSTWGEANGFSHLRASLLGPSVCVPIKDGELSLGTWQQIVVCDFDNRERSREVVVEVITN